MPKYKVSWTQNEARIVTNSFSATVEAESEEDAARMIRMNEVDPDEHQWVRDTEIELPYWQDEHEDLTFSKL